MKSERLLMLVVLIMTILVPAVSAAEQKSFVLDPDNPVFRFSENAFSDNSQSKNFEVLPDGDNFYINIPANSNISNATIQLAGSYQDLGTERRAPGINTDLPGDFDNDLSTLVYHNGRNGGCTIASLDGYFDIPNYSTTFRHCVRVKAGNDYSTSGSFKIYNYNFTNNSWTESFSKTVQHSSSHTLCTPTTQLSKHNAENSTIRLKYYLNWCRSPELSIGGNYNNNERVQNTTYTKEKVPVNPVLKLNNTTIWSFNREFNNSQNAVVEFRNAIQDYVNTSDGGSVPFNLTADRKGNITVSNISINYSYSANLSTIQEPSVSEIEIGTVYSANITQLNSSVQNLSVNYYKLPNNATTCWFNSSESEVLQIENTTVCNITGADLNSTIKIWSDSHDVLLKVEQTNATVSGDSVIVGNNLTIQKNVTVNGNGNLTVKSELANSIENTTQVSDSNNKSVNITIDAGFVKWNANASLNYTVAFETTGPYYSYQDNQSVQKNDVTYAYSANISFPNSSNYSDNLTIQSNTSLLKLTEWGRRDIVVVTIDGNEVNYSLSEEFLVLNLTSNSNQSLQILYTVLPLRNDDVEAPRNYGGGGGGSFSSPNKKKEGATERGGKEKSINLKEELVLVSIETPEVQNEVTTQTSKATGYMSMISLKAKTTRIVLALLCGIFLALAIGTRIQGFKTLVPVKIPAKPVVKVKQIQQAVQQEKPKLNLHIQTILKGLGNREQEILKTLMDYDGHTTQARIYHATGIPTTSLSRWMDSLERRGLVESTRRGKLRDLNVTKKFTGENN